MSRSRYVPDWRIFGDLSVVVLFLNILQAFFNFILNELGIHDATIFELFGVDESSISYLP